LNESFCLSPPSDDNKYEDEGRGRVINPSLAEWKNSCVERRVFRARVGVLSDGLRPARLGFDARIDVCAGAVAEEKDGEDEASAGRVLEESVALILLVLAWCDMPWEVFGLNQCAL
jgi:hypothetical protein